MKKRFLVLTLSASMIAAILVGCGNDKSTTTSNSETEVTTVEESVEDTNASTSRVIKKVVYGNSCVKGV